MAGYGTIYIVGDGGGFKGSDGVNPIYFQILVGHGNRMWLEAHYFDPSIKPIGKLRIIIPKGPDISEEDLLLDAVLAFGPSYFADRCPSLTKVAEKLKDAERLDFNIAPEEVPAEWYALREEARPLLREMSIWRADLTPVW
jgi:hypothetical protein